MRDDVVQLTRDAQTLLLCRVFTLLAMFRDDLEQEITARAHVVAGHPRDQRQHTGRDEALERGVAAEHQKVDAGERDDDGGHGNPLAKG